MAVQNCPYSRIEFHVLVITFKDPFKLKHLYFVWKNEQKTVRRQVDDNRPGLDLHGRAPHSQRERRDPIADHVRRHQVHFQHDQRLARDRLPHFHYCEHIQWHIHHGPGRTHGQKQVRVRQRRIRSKTTAVSGHARHGGHWHVVCRIHW